MIVACIDDKHSIFWHITPENNNNKSQSNSSRDTPLYRVDQKPAEITSSTELAALMSGRKMGGIESSIFMGSAKKPTTIVKIEVRNRCNSSQSKRSLRPYDIADTPRKHDFHTFSLQIN